MIEANACDFSARHRVLVVEDEPFIALDLEDALAFLSCDVVGPFADIVSALSIDPVTVDFALLDIHVRDGLIFPLAARLAGRSIPFAFMSGDSPSDLPDEWKLVPVLRKPYLSDDFERILAMLMH
jgi:DNA-binding NtrC family response regulator